MIDPDHHAPAYLWGLELQELHDRFWASRGVQVVRPDRAVQVADVAELYLLLDPSVLLIARLAPIIDDFAWLDPDLARVRIRDQVRAGYTEQALADAGGRFVRYFRRYAESDPRRGRIGLTRDPELARLWQAAPSPREGWRALRRVVRPAMSWSAAIRGRLYRTNDPIDRADFLEDLTAGWSRPDSTVPALVRHAPNVWSHASAAIDPGARLVGPLWIGAGRTVADAECVIGPGALLDAAPPASPPPDVRWQEIEPLGALALRASARAPGRRPLKRAFDILFSILVLLFTLPLYPVIALLIVLEDGTPVFFSHERETLGGRRFGCIKFRSMRRDAEQVKQELQSLNKADGPQFFIPDDPRLTRVGRILRDLQLDELPQFINVLTGEMSVVGPRPSPHKENQYSPGWREARLSVRPGVTGLWQIMRTRSDGADFQEWIKYDLEYVERQSFRLDLWIVWQTVSMLMRRILRP
jgi:lipopolysaccharide/colanic/teichoic acid biosynthesis glycosyltransferase